MSKNCVGEEQILKSGKLVPGEKQMLHFVQLPDGQSFLCENSCISHFVSNLLKSA